MIEEMILPEVIVPSLYLQPREIAMNLRIHQDPPHYQVDVLVAGNSMRKSIPLKDHDLQEICLDLQRTMGEVAEAILNDNADDRKLKIYKLAYHGKRAFERIFSNPDLRGIVHGVMRRASLVVIQVASEDFFVPWELLYDDEIKGRDVSIDGFWGTRHLINRIITRDRYGDPLYPEIEFTKFPTLGLLIYEELTHVIDKEVPYFEKLAGQGKIGLYKLRRLKPVSQWEDPESWKSEYEEFKKFLGQKLNLAHFACHAFHDQENPTTSNIMLSEAYCISCKDLDVYKIQIESHPFIMLNACSSGSLDPLFTSGLVIAFWEAGAVGVLATECAVPDDFAADFAQRLYKHLLDGEELGASLLATRRYFLSENNPLGLLYAMYGSPSIKLVPKGRRT